MDDRVSANVEDDDVDDDDLQQLQSESDLTPIHTFRENRKEKINNNNIVCSR